MPNTAILINKNVLHQIKPVQDRTGTMFSLDFDESLLGGDASTLIRQRYVEAVTENPTIKFLCLLSDKPWQTDVVKTLLQMYDVFHESRYGYELRLTSLLSSIWHSIICNIQDELQTSLAEKSLDNERVKTAVRFVQEHYSSKITLAQIADAVHISKGECCRCFQRVIKMSPIEFVLQTRISEAAKLLSAPTYSISDVALGVGFTDMSYFGKVFRQRLGCSPSEYRKATLRHL